MHVLEFILNHRHIDFALQITMRTRVNNFLVHTYILAHFLFLFQHSQVIHCVAVIVVDFLCLL